MAQVKADVTDLLARLVHLLSHENAEVSCAAALVLGELRLDTDDVRRGLRTVLDKGGETVRRYALQALERIGVQEEFADLIPLLGGGKETARRAADLIVAQGAQAVPDLVQAVRSDVGQLRIGALEALARIDDRAAREALREFLAHTDIAVAQQACDALSRRATGADPDERSRIADSAAAALRRMDPRKRPELVAACVRLLGLLGSPDALRAILPWLAKGNAPTVRTQALHALGHVEIPAREQDAVLKKLVLVLDDENFDGVVRPGLDAISKLPLQRRHLSLLQGLLKSPHRSVRAFAVKAVGSLGGAAAAKIAFTALEDPERKVQEAAAAALSSDPAYAQKLLASIDTAKTPQEAWKVATLLMRQREKLDKKLLATFAKRALGEIGKPQGKFQAFFEVVRAAGPDVLREVFLRKAQELFPRRKAAEAYDLLRHLDREDLASPGGDLLLSLSISSRIPKDLSRLSTDGGRALGFLLRYLHRTGHEGLKEFERWARYVEPDDALYLGFHMTERPGEDRRMGQEILRFLIRRWPKSEAAQTAQRKVRTEGGRR